MQRTGAWFQATGFQTFCKISRTNHTFTIALFRFEIVIGNKIHVQNIFITPAAVLYFIVFPAGLQYIQHFIHTILCEICNTVLYDYICEYMKHL